MTRGLEGRCSVQLSYGRKLRPSGDSRRGQQARGKSGRSDLNRGPPAPKAGALTGLRYAPLRAKKASGWWKVGQPVTARKCQASKQCGECAEGVCAMTAAVLFGLRKLSKGNVEIG